MLDSSSADALVDSSSSKHSWSRSVSILSESTDSTDVWVRPDNDLCTDRQVCPLRERAAGQIGVARQGVIEPPRVVGDEWQVAGVAGIGESGHVSARPVVAGREDQCGLGLGMLLENPGQVLHARAKG